MISWSNATPGGSVSIDEITAVLLRPAFQMLKSPMSFNVEGERHKSLQKFLFKKYFKGKSLFYILKDSAFLDAAFILNYDYSYLLT